ncbi:MAG: hypothetical protein LBI72_07710 [Flavobacteriaceae bacterium]|jgi:hypothetical protein|nr:hypothetical protein [Flavobacteriaceae bacterium]
MKHTYLLLGLLLLFFSSCKINQKLHGEPIGRWVYKAKLPEGTDVHRGRYDRNGYRKGTWRFRYEGRLYRKEIYKDSVATVILYHDNRKVRETGHTKLSTTLEGLHFYYFGPWFVYNSKGELIEVKHFELGLLKHHTIVKP